MNVEPLQFVDPNVIIYAHDNSAGEKHTRARALLERLQQEQQLSIWDAMILHSAAHLGCKTLWSEDLSPRVYGGVQVVNPFLEA